MYKIPDLNIGDVYFTFGGMSTINFRSAGRQWATEYSVFSILSLPGHLKTE